MRTNPPIAKIPKGWTRHTKRYVYVAIAVTVMTAATAVIGPTRALAMLDIALNLLDRTGIDDKPMFDGKHF